jgi:hypothetical protein
VPTALIDRFSRAVGSRLQSIQDDFVLAYKSLRFIFARPFYTRDVSQQMGEIGMSYSGS